MSKIRQGVVTRAEEVRHKDFGEAIQKWSTCRFLWGQMISGSVIYSEVAVKQIRS